MGYRRLNREASREFSTLTNPKEAVTKIGLEDKIVGAGKDMFELEQQARVPNLIEHLCDVEKDTSSMQTILLKQKIDNFNKFRIIYHLKLAVSFKIRMET